MIEPNINQELNIINIEKSINDLYKQLDILEELRASETKKLLLELFEIYKAFKGDELEVKLKEWFDKNNINNSKGLLNISYETTIDCTVFEILGIKYKYLSNFIYKDGYTEKMVGLCDKGKIFTQSRIRDEIMDDGYWYQISDINNIIV